MQAFYMHRQLSQPFMCVPGSLHEIERTSSIQSAMRVHGRRVLWVTRSLTLHGRLLAHQRAAIRHAPSHLRFASANTHQTTLLRLGSLSPRCFESRGVSCRTLKVSAS